MAEAEQKYPLDFRRGGDTVHDFASKYIGEIPIIYDLINSIRGNRQSPSKFPVAPMRNQWYVDSDGGIYMRSVNNSTWNFIGQNKPFLGMKDADDDTEFLTGKDLSSDGNEPGKIPVINDNGLIAGSITGNAAKVGGFTVDMSGVRDGQILGYNAAENKIIGVNRVQTGDGNITCSRDKPNDGSFWIKPFEVVP